jgi:hypothetical protein
MEPRMQGRSTIEIGEEWSGGLSFEEKNGKQEEQEGRGEGKRGAGVLPISIDFFTIQYLMISSQFYRYFLFDQRTKNAGLSIGSTNPAPLASCSEFST